MNPITKEMKMNSYIEYLKLREIPNISQCANLIELLYLQYVVKNSKNFESSEYYLVAGDLTKIRLNINDACEVKTISNCKFDTDLISENEIVKKLLGKTELATEDISSLRQQVLFKYQYILTSVFIIDLMIAERKSQRNKWLSTMAISIISASAAIIAVVLKDWLK